MVGERITAIPRNIKADVNDLRYSGVVKGTKNIARRFMDENKASYHRTKALVKRSINKVKSVVKR